MQCFVAHLVVTLVVQRVENERFLRRLNHAYMAKFVNEETTPGQRLREGCCLEH